MNYYVDYKFYEDEYQGELDEEEFKEKLYEAQEKIDEVTFNRIVKNGFENLTPFQKEKIMRAMCFQIDYISENVSEDSDDVSSYSVLDISVTVNDTVKSIARKLHMSSMAYSLLKKTGLTNRSFRWR